MVPPLLFLLLLLLLPLSLRADSPPPPRGIHINCGAQKEQTVGGIPWISDEGFVTAGNASSVNTPGIAPVLSTLRYFPDKAGRKFCYVIPVAKGSKYLVRTTYYYGGFDGGDEPPVFEQIIGGTKWSKVDTKENYAKGLTTYYEIVTVALGKTLSVCVARSMETSSTSNPFISAIELEFLEDTMYNATDFSEYALATIARHSFGHNGTLISYPDDPYNRYWEPFIDENPIVESHSNITSSDFWNHPPESAFATAFTTSRGKSLSVQWPVMELPATSYYMALYFQDTRTPSPYSWRVFDVSVNGKSFISGVNVSTAGVMVYGTNWPLSGKTQITLTPVASSPVGPLINAAEILQVVHLGGRTNTRDVIAMEDLARSFSNPPMDWSGDPCLPVENSWTGVTCSQGKLARVISLNLPGHGLSGALPDSIANLTAIQSIFLGWNQFSGPIPDLSPLKELTSLHLENNQLTGSIPPSLGELEKIKEIYLQNNHLHGQVPESLKKRTGVEIQISPGNQIG